ncbi:MAG: hypothetical protein CUN52_01560 [Phototrophicales bacterium]|nr:MAG: hypothetical protein CUN52_01560 [Phototrophicales bacterium]
MRLIISHLLQSELIHHAKTGYPHEVCGLLVGRGEHILRVIPTENHAPDTQRGFLISTQDLNIHLPQIRAEGLSLIGFYHSHPDAPAIPSPTDVRELDNGLQLPHVVLSISHHQVHIKAWLIHHGQVDPIEWVIGDAAPILPAPPTTSAQRIAFLWSIGISLILLLIIALTLLPPAPKLP